MYCSLPVVWFGYLLLFGLYKKDETSLSQIFSGPAFSKSHYLELFFGPLTVRDSTLYTVYRKLYEIFYDVLGCFGNHQRSYEY